MGTGSEWRGVALAFVMGGLAGCVSLGEYRDLQEKYEHLVDAKLDMDREYAESRRQLLAVEEQHAKLAGQIAALERDVEGKIRAITGPLAADVAKLQAERAAAFRDRTREEATQADRHRLMSERVEHLAAQVDRLADRLTRVEVVGVRATGSAGAKPKPKAVPARTTSVENGSSSGAGAARADGPPAKPAGTETPGVEPKHAAPSTVEQRKEAESAGSPPAVAKEPAIPPPPAIGLGAPRAEAAPTKGVAR